MKKKAFFLIPFLAGPFPWLAGQSLNSFLVYDGTTEYASRGYIGKGDGECLQRFPSSHFGCLPRIKAVGFTLQDENAATPEKFWIVFRKANAGGEPDLSPGGMMAMQVPYFTSGYAGRRACSVTSALARPLFRSGCCKSSGFFYGLRLEKARNWPNDGLSIHMDGYFPALPCGAHCRTGAFLSLAWNVKYVNGSPYSSLECGGNRAWNISLQVEGTVLQGITAIPGDKCPSYAPGPSRPYGNPGCMSLWPDVSRGVVVGWRIKENNISNGIGFVFVGGSAPGSGIPVPPYGTWCVHPFFFFF